MIYEIEVENATLMRPQMLFAMVTSALPVQRVAFACSRGYQDAAEKNLLEAEPLLVKVLGQRCVIMFSETYRAENVDGLYGWISRSCNLPADQVRAVSFSQESAFLLWLYTFQRRFGITATLMNPPKTLGMEITSTDSNTRHANSTKYHHFPVMVLPAMSEMRELCREAGADLARLDRLLGDSLPTRSEETAPLQTGGCGCMILLAIGSAAAIGEVFGSLAFA